MAFYAGFDTEVFPGAAMMAWLQANSNLKWCGYYLAPAPNRGPTGWPGQYQSLSSNWGVVPIYVGQQDARTGNAAYKPSSILTSAQGTTDGQNAANLADKDQFPHGSFIYLDWEYGGLDGAGAGSYVSSWVASIIADGRFMPGLYCSHSTAPAIAALLNAMRPIPPARFWCWKVPTTNTHPYSGDIAAVPAPDPAGCGFAHAVSWQRDQNTVVSFPSTSPKNSLEVDFSASSFANPAAP